MDIEIQLQQIASKEWTTMRMVVNISYEITRAMENLKMQYPEQRVRAVDRSGRLVDILC